MPSRALTRWRTERLAALDEIEVAHAAVGGTGPGRRTLTQQVNRAYVLVLSSQFQGFCRDLHTEAAAAVIGHVAERGVRPEVVELLAQRLTLGRKLDRGNPNPGNVGSDFADLGVVDLWARTRRLDARNVERQRQLQLLMEWRNAVAHDDFGDVARLGGIRSLRLAHARRWRSTCEALAPALDRVAADALRALLGTRPWEG